MSRDAALTALDRIDPELGAFTEVDRDKVLAAVEAPRAGRLSGLLIAVKDLIDTAGLRTTYGSRFFEDHVPERNAPAVDALEAEGAIVLGKTNLNEFAYGVSATTPITERYSHPKTAPEPPVGPAAVPLPRWRPASAGWPLALTQAARCGYQPHAAASTASS